MYFLKIDLKIEILLYKLNEVPYLLQDREYQRDVQ